MAADANSEGPVGLECLLVESSLYDEGGAPYVDHAAMFSCESTR